MNWARAPATSWREFWDRPHHVYVNERHLLAHYRVIADEILALAPGRNATVLDYGCGEALDAARVAAAVGRLCLYDTAHSVTARLSGRYFLQRFLPSTTIRSLIWTGCRAQNTL